MGYFYNSSQTGRARTVSLSSTVEDQIDILYTCPTNVRAYMSLFFIKNASGATCTVQADWNRANDPNVFILTGVNMSAGQYIQFSNGFIVFEPGDQFRVRASNNASPRIDTFATVEEFFQTQ